MQQSVRNLLCLLRCFGKWSLAAEGYRGYQKNIPVLLEGVPLFFPRDINSLVAGAEEFYRTLKESSHRQWLAYIDLQEVNLPALKRAGSAKLEGTIL